MTLLTIKYTVQHIAQLFGKPLTMALEQFNNLLATAQDELFKEFVYGYANGSGAEVDSRVAHALIPFKTHNGHSGSQASAYGLVIGKYLMSDDMFHLIGAFAVYDTSDYPNKMIPVDIITATELLERTNNSITYPTSNQPVGFLERDKTTDDLLLYLFPYYTSFPMVEVMYYKKPTTPSLVITYANGIETQSSSSVDLQFDSIYHIDIIRKILGYLGVAVSNPQIAQIVEETKTDER